MPDVRDRSAVIYRAKDLVAAWKSYQDNRTPGQMAVVEIKIEELLDLLLTEWRGEVTREEADRAFSPDLDYLDPEVLDTIPDPLVPIAIMREVMSRYMILPNISRVSNWGMFWKTYGEKIMAAR